MKKMVQYPALEALRAHLQAQAYRLGAGDAAVAMAALREYLHHGASLDRALRDDVATFRPADAVGAAIAYLFIVTIDAATHQGREGALVAYAASEQPLAQEAGALLALLQAPEFLAARGVRPVVSQRADGRGCGAA
jgi:hypothetical protein